MYSSIFKTILTCCLLLPFAPLEAQTVIGHTNFGAQSWKIIYEKGDGSKEIFSGNNTLFSQTLATFIDFEVPLEEEEDGIRDGKERHFWFWKHRPLSDYRIPLMKVDSITETCDARDYQTVFVEDFDGTELDTTLWYPNYALDTFGSQEFSVWSLPSMVKVEDGNLKLGVRYFEAGEFRQFTRDGVTYSDTRNHHGGVIVSRTLPDTGPNPVGGCWQYGRYTFRAKLSRPATTPAIWFFGWPGEADLIEVRPENNFKRLVHGYHSWNVVDDCDRGITQRELKRTTPANRGCSSEQIADWHLLTNKSSDNPPTLYSEYHEFTYEWTPFKQLFMVDGVVELEVFRYYEVRFVKGAAFQPDVVYLRGLDCDEIPTNTLLPLVWENLSWNRMSRFGMDMIISQSAEKNAPSPNEDFLIDWIRVEQRRGSAWGLRTDREDRSLCLGETMNFTLEKGDLENPTTWTASDQLAIVSATDSSLTVRAVTPGKAFLEARFNNPLSCHDIVQRQPLQVGPPLIETVQATYLKCRGYQLNSGLEGFQGVASWDVQRPGQIVETYTGTNEVFIPMELGDSVAYTLRVENPCGDDTYHGTLTIQTDDCDGFDLQVYPNPATTSVNYILGRTFRREELTPEQVYTLRLVDAKGMVVRDMVSQQGTGTLEVSDLPSGVYYLVVNIGKRLVASRAVVKE